MAEGITEAATIAGGGGEKHVRDGAVVTAIIDPFDKWFGTCSCWYCCDGLCSCSPCSCITGTACNDGGGGGDGRAPSSSSSSTSSTVPILSASDRMTDGVAGLKCGVAALPPSLQSDAVPFCGWSVNPIALFGAFFSKADDDAFEPLVSFVIDDT